MSVETAKTAYLLRTRKKREENAAEYVVYQTFYVSGPTEIKLPPTHSIYSEHPIGPL